MMDYMAIEIIMLSVLRNGPVHGYELKRRLHRTALTSLSNNSIYPILRRFESIGAVTKQIEEQKGKPSRNVYTITDSGRALFGELISTLAPHIAANDEEFMARVSFFHELTTEQRQAILDTRAVVLDESIAQLETLMQESTRPWRTMAMAQVIAQRRSERLWISDLMTKAKL